MKKDLKKVLIVYNPVSGWMPSKSLLFNLMQRLASDGYLSVVYITSKDESTTEVLKDISEGCEKIICCGGDGTLHDVLNGVIRNQIHLPVGYIPIGTTNDFANTHNLPSDLNEAYKAFINNNTQLLDIGSFCQNSYFTYIACFGLFTKLTYLAPQPLKNSLGQFAYIIEGTKELGDITKGYHMKIQADDKTYEGDFIFGAVTNSLNFAGFFTMPVTLEDLSDGKFEVLLIKKPANLFELQDVAGSMMTSSYESENMIFFKAQKIRFIAEEPIAWNLDGEFAGNKREVLIEVKNQRLEILTQ